tara:strand:+ start:162 stop:455 length:294 start_codon:yes stop_codon:yes gene_type:complete
VQRKYEKEQGRRDRLRTTFNTTSQRMGIDRRKQKKRPPADLILSNIGPSTKQAIIEGAKQYKEFYGTGDDDDDAATVMYDSDEDKERATLLAPPLRL